MFASGGWEEDRVWRVSFAAIGSRLSVACHTVSPAFPNSDPRLARRAEHGRRAASIAGLSCPHPACLWCLQTLSVPSGPRCWSCCRRHPRPRLVMPLRCAMATGRPAVRTSPSWTRAVAHVSPHHHPSPVVTFTCALLPSQGPTGSPASIMAGCSKSPRAKWAGWPGFSARSGARSGTCPSAGLLQLAVMF